MAELKLDIYEFDYMVILASEQTCVFDFAKEHGSTKERVLLIRTSTCHMGIYVTEIPKYPTCRIAVYISK